MINLKSITTTVAILIIVLLQGCLTNDEKVENAKEKVERANENLKETEKNADQFKQHEKEWGNFKLEANQEIKENRIKMDSIALKIKLFTNDAAKKAQQKIDILRLKNEKLQENMDQFKIGKDNWEDFNTEFKQDLKGLGNAIKDFFVQN